MESPDFAFADAVRLPHGLWLAGVDTTGSWSGGDPWDFITDPTNWLDVGFAQYDSAIDTNMATKLEEAWAAGSPYAAITAYDPSPALSTLEGRTDALQEAVDALEPTDDWEAAILAATTYYDANLDTEAYIDDVIEGEERIDRNVFFRQLSQAECQAWAIQGVVNTQFGIMVAQAESDRASNLAISETKLHLMARVDRTKAIMNIANALLGRKRVQLDILRMSAAVQTEAAQFEIVAKQDQENVDLEWATKDALWDLELFDYPNVMMNSLAGARLQKKPMSNVDRVIGSVLNSGNIMLQTYMQTKSPELAIGLGATNLLGGLVTTFQ